MKKAREIFPPEFCHFLEENLKAEPEFLRRKILEADTDKFLAEKPALTIDNIKRLLPPEFWDLLDHFLPKNANKLPPHRPWDHKIELVPGKQPPYARNRPLSPIELKCVKK